MSFNENVQLIPTHPWRTRWWRWWPRRTGWRRHRRRHRRSDPDLILMFLGVNPAIFPLPTDPGSGGGGGQINTEGGKLELLAHCETGADAKQGRLVPMVATENSLQAFWGTELQRRRSQVQWREPTSPCIRAPGSPRGTASNQVGPFYRSTRPGCLHRRRLLRSLEQQFGAKGSRSPRSASWPTSSVTPRKTGPAWPRPADPNGPESGAVLQAHGRPPRGRVAKHASETPAPGSDTPMLPLTDDDIRDALSSRGGR